MGFGIGAANIIIRKRGDMKEEYVVIFNTERVVNFKGDSIVALDFERFDSLVDASAYALRKNGAVLRPVQPEATMAKTDKQAQDGMTKINEILFAWLNDPNSNVAGKSKILKNCDFTMLAERLLALLLADRQATRDALLDELEREGLNDRMGLEYSAFNEGLNTANKIWRALLKAKRRR